MAGAADDVAELHAQLVRVVHQIALAGAQELRGHGLSPAQYQVLVLAHRRPGIVQRELTEVLGVTKGNVSQLLTRLQDAGLLVRTPEGAANRIELTGEGAALVRRLVPEHRRFLERSYSALGPGERALLADLLGRLEVSP